MGSEPATRAWTIPQGTCMGSLNPGAYVDPSTSWSPRTTTVVVDGHDSGVDDDNGAPAPTNPRSDPHTQPVLVSPRAPWGMVQAPAPHDLKGLRMKTFSIEQCNHAPIAVQGVGGAPCHTIPM
jgi:hypothetical protein